MQQCFDLFMPSAESGQLYCPDCEDELEETMENERLFCVACQKTVAAEEAKDDISIEKLFGVKSTQTTTKDRL